MSKKVPGPVDVLDSWEAMRETVAALSLLREDRGLQPRQLSRAITCKLCKKTARNGIEMQTMGALCSECAVSLARVTRLYADDSSPAVARFEPGAEIHLLKDYFLSSGILRFASVARHAEFSQTAHAWITDLGAAAVMTRVFGSAPAHQEHLFYWARAALRATERCVLYRVTPAVSEMIKRTRIEGPIWGAPNALDRPLFVELTPSEGDTRLVGDVTFLGCFPFHDELIVIGYGFPGTPRIVRLQPSWGLPLEEAIAASGMSVIENQEHSNELLQFLITFAVYLEAQPPPMKMENSRLLLSRLPGFDRTDDAFASERLINFDPGSNSAIDSHDDPPSGTLKFIDADDIPLVVWTPNAYTFRQLAFDCEMIEALVTQFRRVSRKQIDPMQALRALTYMARVDEELPRLRVTEAEASSSVEVDGKAWTFEMCQGSIEKNWRARPDLISFLRPLTKHRRQNSGRERTLRAQAAEVDKLRAALEQATQRAAELEEQIRVQEAALAERLRQQSSPQEVEPEEVQTLRAKIRRLKTLIDEGNAERRSLRQKLADSSPVEPPSPAPTPSTPDEEDRDFDSFDQATGFLRPRIPNVTSHAQAALGSLPGPVASAALRLIGELSAGDAGAWRGVKQAKQMPQPLLMGRVGIHHRLLFRQSDLSIEVLDVVSRQALPLALKRLRAIA